jgi:glycosyltransferase involved in cell wall biosynthesis
MSLLIGTPVFNSLSLEPFNASCYNLKKELTGTSFPHDFLRITNESLVTRARNVIASDFLDGTEFDCLLFIDADIEFDPADVARLWNLCYTGADVAVGHYRHKNQDAKNEVWVNGKLQPLENFPEPFEVDFAGTGFMMIRRETFHALGRAHPDWEYQEGFPEQQPRNVYRTVALKECWAFFQDPIEDGCHLSEDYFFCKRVRELGMKVIMDPEIKLKHWGWYPY